MTPTVSPFQVVRTFEANGTSTRSSVTGSASMSARSATTGPGSAPLSRPTTPVWATPVRTSSKPSARRCSATMPAVRNSRLPSSGLACRSRRQAISCASMSTTAASIAAARLLGPTRVSVTVVCSVAAYLMVAAPTLQATSSCEPVPPEQPIAPISLPPSTSGMPPREAMTPSRVRR